MRTEPFSSTAGSSTSIEPGDPYPLGATPVEGRTNFAVFSDHAERIELCLYSEDGATEVARYDLPECTDGSWHGFIPGVGAGTTYGYRVHGPWAPEAGHRFNPAKLLIDPYARELAGPFTWDDALFGYTVGPDPDADLTRDDRDSGPFIPKGRIVGTLQRRRPPRRVEWSQTVVYEAQVRGLTMRHPLISEDIRGTFAALGAPPMVEYLKRLGITTLELLPVQAFLQDRHLLERGLSNYWGYNTLSFFAPEPRFMGPGGRDEIVGAVERLASAGIEVILDVVYNHTCEGNHLGPTLSWRGFDNAAYYRLLPGDPRYYDDLTGTGNSLDTNHPRVLQMVMDSLRLWASEYGVGGFRFDLATTLGRRPEGFDPAHPFFHAIMQDPLLGRLKLIAEPWDVGPGGYQLGSFPAGFSEWNGDYRDVVRDFWSGRDGTMPDFARRFAASSDLFGEGRRRPWSSVNFVTAHDGFTLADVVSYNDKRNEANGEDGRDGHDDNRSWNCGAEGETDDAEILALRAQQTRNYLTTLMLSQGVPMLLAGGECGNSQGGNNNAYCQDNEIGWIDWHGADADLIAFVRKLIDFRNSRSAINRSEFLTGARDDRGRPDVTWYSAGGHRMTEEEWQTSHVKCLTVRLSPKDAREPMVLVMLNGAHHGVEFTVPGADNRWKLVITTVDREEQDETRASGEMVTLAGRSLVVWEQLA